MRLDIPAVERNARTASTEDLLDRATVYRAGMEPAALAVIEAELLDRGLGAGDLANHAADRAGVLTRDGVAERCSFCDRPAVAARLGWHKWWGRLPLFPRRLRYCGGHAG